MIASEEDLKATTKRFLDELVGARSGDSILLCTDASTCQRLRKSIMSEMEIRGGSCISIKIEAQTNLEDSAGLISSALQQYGSTILCELGERTFYQSSAWSEAVRLGTRIYSLVHLDAEAFLRCVQGIDHTAMLKFGEKLHSILRGAQTIDIQSKAGTHLRLKKHEGRARKLANRLLRRPSACTWAPTGVLRDDIQATFLGGQISFRPEMGSLEGSAVIDGFLWPPNDCGRLANPLMLRFQRGQLTSIDYSNFDSIGHRLKQHLDGLPASLEHVSIGFHPGATLSGGIHEAERVSGALVVGIGQGERHVDGVMMAVSLQIDGIPLLHNGAFLHPWLA